MNTSSLMFSASKLWILALLVSGLSSLGLAEETHYDLFVTGSGAGSSLVIGGYDDALGTAVVPAGQMRVFGGEVVGTGTSAPYESEAPGEPGFRAGEQTFLDDSDQMTPAGTYTALPASTALNFNFQPISIGTATRNLFFWDGDGTVAFTPVASNVALSLTKPGGGGWTESINGSSSGTIAGNTIQDTSGTGVVHTHLFTSIAKDNAGPDQGFYLFSLDLEMAGLTSSGPIYFVYGAVDPTNLAPQFADLAAFELAHDAAIGWVEASIVPEPSTLALAALAAAAAVPLARRLRRR